LDNTNEFMNINFVVFYKNHSFTYIDTIRIQDSDQNVKLIMRNRSFMFAGVIIDKLSKSLSWQHSLFLNLGIKFIITVSEESLESDKLVQTDFTLRFVNW
jgi:hypothetical protein